MFCVKDWRATINGVTHIFFMVSQDLVERGTRDPCTRRGQSGLHSMIWMLTTYFFSIQYMEMVPYNNQGTWMFLCHIGLWWLLVISKYYHTTLRLSKSIVTFYTHTKDLKTMPKEKGESGEHFVCKCIVCGTNEEGYPTLWLLLIVQYHWATNHWQFR